MGAFAAQSAFFIFLSFFPLISIIITVPQFLPITQDELISLVCRLLPAKFESYVTNVVKEIYEGASDSVTVISVITALWSSSKGLMAIRNGLNEVYRSREQRNYVIIRGISAVYTLLLAILMIALVPINMFGTQIAEFIIRKFPFLQDLTLLVYGMRTSVTFVLLFLLFWVLYTVVPTRKTRFREQIPGALFAALTWVLITRLYSLYIEKYANTSYMYGSLTTVIFLMFWLYFVIYMLFIGAQINEYMSQCRQKEQEYELKQYTREQAEEIRDDDLFGEEQSSVDLPTGESSMENPPRTRHDYASEEVQQETEEPSNSSDLL